MWTLTCRLSSTCTQIHTHSHTCALPCTLIHAHILTCTCTLTRVHTLLHTHTLTHAQHTCNTHFKGMNGPYHIGRLLRRLEHCLDKEDNSETARTLDCPQEVICGQRQRHVHNGPGARGCTVPCGSPSNTPHPLCNLRKAESWDHIPGTDHLSLKPRLESLIKRLFWTLLHLLHGQT